MSLDHLDLLRHELPELFQDRDLGSRVDDELIIIPIREPESIARNRFPSSLSDVVGELDAAVLEGLGENFLNSDMPFHDLMPHIEQLLGGAHSGAPQSYTDPTRMPPPDCLAFYLPFHYYHPNWWGVYLLLDGVIWLAGEIVRRSGGIVSGRQAMQAARLFLYHHEAFHHKTECLSARLELTHRRPFYKTGFERLYQKTLGTNDCLEEGLANASALMDSRKKMRSPSVDDALCGYVSDSPPGYDQGARIRKTFLSTRCVFAEENQNVCLPLLPPKNPEVWRTTPHMFDGIANIKSRVNYVIPRRSPLVARLPLRPLLPPTKLVKKLEELAGLSFLKHGSRHDIYRTRAGRKIQIPRHARDLGHGLVRKILKQSGVDMGLEAFLQA